VEIESFGRRVRAQTDGLSQAGKQKYRHATRINEGKRNHSQVTSGEKRVTFEGKITGKQRERHVMGFTGNKRKPDNMETPKEDRRFPCQSSVNKV
jgi:hypothetical protein